MDVRLPDGTIIKNVPDGTSKADLMAKLTANGYKSSEKIEIIKVVKSTVGSKIKVISGAGDNETEYSINQAKRTAEAGADGLLVVTPYYNKPPQAGI